jgi:hypothetical protein
MARHTCSPIIGLASDESGRSFLLAYSWKNPVVRTLAIRTLAVAATGNGCWRRNWPPASPA